MPTEILTMDFGKAGRTTYVATGDRMESIKAARDHGCHICKEDIAGPEGDYFDCNEMVRKFRVILNPLRRHFIVRHGGGKVVA
jgi:hypothetical protein